MNQTEISDKVKEFGDHIQPQLGFVYPNVKDTIVCVAGYQTPSHRDGVISAGAVGKVVEIRRSGSFAENPGYIGCVVFFEEIKQVYPAGLVIPWDKASDPAQFQFSHT